jgi:hypothetical protein
MVSYTYLVLEKGDYICQINNGLDTILVYS